MTMRRPATVLVIAGLAAGLGLAGCRSEGEAAGSATNGAAMGAPERSWRVLGTVDGLPSDRTTCVAVDGKRTWCGTDRGLVLLDEDGLRVFTQNDGLCHDVISDLLLDGEGRLWIATLDGVSCYDGTGFAAYTTENSGLIADVVHALALDGDTLYALTAGGVARCDTGVREWEPLNADAGPSPFTPCLAACFGDSQGYFATYGAGLWHLERETGAWTQETVKGLRADCLATAVVSNSDALWLGTRDGLWRRPHGETDWERTSASLLQHAAVSALAGDDATLWVGTDEGFALLEGGVWTHFSGAEDEMGRSGAVCVRDIAVGYGGTVWVATSVGLCRGERAGAVES